ncbi:FMN adenylyltransferase /riboflavin kinase [Litorimonas taeanensis]|uniref:Riboflavin biosynthesis protein n=1 Tax=Litorimonas taeanensis TaxID=568099 RepID=A0A420WEY9_9PROT|nr:bifunctional riboflavin kinase/FAD synthetase [Litorimonas taeanensis]RKQ69543.1 FMN adenylyltransferase /riboflavin kinase [Litorimonas taeanensis]
MKTLTSYSGLKASDKGAVLALGNFDGLHRGHQAVIATAKSIAKDLKAPLGIGLFRPHPFRFFKPEAPPFRLMSPTIRAEIMAELGVEHLYEIPFTAELRDLEDTEFVEQVLHEGLGIRHVVVGEDYGFGKNRCGNVESLKRLCAARNIGVTAMPPVGLHQLYGKYGSTEIRKALQSGDVFHAHHMLSRPWTVDGTVQKGQQRGRTINFPTANLEFGDLVRPKFGVYCVDVQIDGETERRPAVANTGNRPTVGGEDARLEVHILDFDRDLYGQRITVRFRSFIRAEKKFESFEALKTQIEKDAQGARAVFGLKL